MSWMEVFVTKIGGFQLLVIVIKDFVWDVAGVLYVLFFNVYFFLFENRNLFQKKRNLEVATKRLLQRNVEIRGQF